VFYVVESSKSFQEVVFDLEPVVQRLGFVVLHRHDLAEILYRREIGIDEECMVFDIANYRHLERLLACGLRLSALLPWRISVFTENGVTRLALLRPETLLAPPGSDPVLARLAAEMEEKMVQIVDEAR